jgi:hypothetical protein
MHAFVEAFYANYPMIVWKGSRGLAGKTTLLALLGHMETIALGASVVILGGSGEQSARVHASQDKFWSFPGAPVDLVRTRTKTRTDLTNGGHAVAITASSRSVRGPHPQRLRIDEADEVDLDIFDAAMGQTMRADNIKAQTVVSSTHQYADGTMSEVLRRGAERGWPVRMWCWRETVRSNGGWLDDGEVERKRGDMTADMWDTEVELGDPDPTSKAIDPASVEMMFDYALGEYAAPKAGDRQLLVFERPVPGAHYALGFDWAKEKDSTICVVWRVDVEPYRLVLFSKDRRRPWPVMVKQADDINTLYAGVAAHDNTGIGDVVDDIRSTDMTPVQLVGVRRSDMLSKYIAACESHSFRAPRIAYMHGEHSTATNAHIYGNKHLPDTICAGALALWAHQHIKRKVSKAPPRPRSFGKRSFVGGRDSTH